MDFQNFERLFCNEAPEIGSYFSNSDNFQMSTRLVIGNAFVFFQSVYGNEEVPDQKVKDFINNYYMIFKMGFSEGSTFGERAGSKLTKDKLKKGVEDILGRD